MPESDAQNSTQATPDYAKLVKFLVEPFLEMPESLRVDCEVSPSRGKVWVRVAFEGVDKGRVFGRGGRNIQAIRSVLEASARAAGYSAYLDVFGSPPASRNGDSDRDESTNRSPRRSSSVKEAPKLRSRNDSHNDSL